MVIQLKIPCMNLVETVLNSCKFAIKDQTTDIMLILFQPMITITTLRNHLIANELLELLQNMQHYMLLSFKYSTFNRF